MPYVVHHHHHHPPTLHPPTAAPGLLSKVGAPPLFREAKLMEAKRSQGTRSAESTSTHSLTHSIHQWPLILGGAQHAVVLRGAELIGGSFGGADCRTGDTTRGRTMLVPSDDSTGEHSTICDVCMLPFHAAVRQFRMYLERVTAPPGPRHRYLTKESYHNSYVKNVLVKYCKCDCGHVPTTKNLASPPAA